MKKHLLILILMMGVCAVAQDYNGIHSSTYLPLQNINNQPADLIRTDRRWHINVLSPQVAMVNNMAFNESDFLKSLTRVGFGDLKHFFASEQSVLLGRGRIMFPSVAFKLNEKHAFAFSINMRADGIYRSSNDEITQLFRGLDHPEGLDDLSDEYFKSVVNQWTEFTFTWSGRLMDKGEHQLTGGVNVKYLVGGGSGFFDLDGIDVKYDRERLDYLRLDISYGINKNLSATIDDGRLDLFGDKGVGMDIGLSYSYKPDDSRDIPYKYKLGLLIGDIGYVQQKSEVQKSNFQISVEDVPYSKFTGISTMEALIDTLRSIVAFEEVDNSSYRMDLPTSVMISGDYCFRTHWFVSGYVSHKPGFYKRMGNVVERSFWRGNITPRFENRTWGVYMPFDYSTLDFFVGLAFRWKGLFVGSSSVVGNMISGEKGKGELYFGLNIPIGKME